ncbi:methionyl-tRNA formyltransferase [Candidatus Uhrbacteria bacterium RIFCSPHIGHO2_01_FULL_47_10]|nr:MAG: methionyl-tRNA formyltransferase [Candidatus Uhrbacteria bacterium RIFCSPHIGHO2_01_FULL_47_10]
MKTRVVYFGSPELSVPFLSALVQSTDFDVVAVVTQPEKPVGRKAIMTKSAVHEFSLKHNIPALTYKSLRTEEVAAELSKLNADVFVVVVYGKIIPKAVLDLPKFGCINVHPSLLPKYRGPSPFQEAIRMGEKVTGVSIMLLDEGMDTGPVLAVREFPIDERETGETIQPKIIAIGVPLFLEALRKWTTEERVAIPQDNALATYSKMLAKEDGKIDWSKSAVEIDRHVRAMKPWPGTYFVWGEDGNNVRIVVHEVQHLDGMSDRAPGSVLEENGHISVVCVDHSLLELITIQPEGKQKMSPNEYVRGHKTFLETNFLRNE